MPAANKTKNLNLPQYTENDPISFLQDINDAFKAIDDNVDDMNAEIASSGYDDTGIKEEIVAAKAVTTSHITNESIHVTAADRTQWSGKAAPSRTEYHTLTVDGWTEQEDGTFTQVITLENAIVGDAPVDVGEVSEGITADLVAVVSAAMLSPTAVEGMIVTVTAFGTKPEVDIPIFVIVGS